MGTLQDRVAIVSGSGRGIGRAIALKLASEGARVVVNDLDAEPAAEVVAAIEAAGGRATACVGNVTDADFGERFVGTATETFGGLDIIVNNAGYTWDSVIQKMTDDQFDAMYQVHVAAPFRILRAATEPLRLAAKREKEEGREVFRKVVNISSMAGTNGNAGQVNYSSAKAALVGMTKTLSKEWGRHKVNVNCVAFGFIETRLTQPLTEGDASIAVEGREIKVGVQPAMIQALSQMIPLGRPGTPEEAAGAVYLFCTPESDYISGQVIQVGGGISLKERAPMYLTQGIHRAVQINRDGIATACHGRERTWGAFADRVARLAGALRGLGVGVGDRVSMLALNSDRYAEFYYATFWLGAVAVPVNTRWSVPEILYSLDDAEPRVLLFDDAFVEQASALRRDARSLRDVIFAGEGTAPDWALDVEALIAGADPVADLRHGGQALAAIMYTGGTTGFPKGVMLSHDGLAFNAVGTAATFGVSERTVVLHAAPMFHLADAMMLFQTTFVAGTHVIVPGFAPQPVCDAIATRGVTHSLLVPTMIRLVVDHLEASGQRLPNLEYLIYGASPIPEAVLRRAMAVLPATRFVQAFGQTELSPVATLLGAEHHVPDGTRLRSAGRAMAGVDVAIIDEDGREVPRGTVGEVWVRGPNTMLGYWRREQATAETLVDGWVRMGDAAYMDDDGFVFVVDRVKDMIISGGENVYSAEVENALMQHAGVGECAVIGVPDERWGERVHAVVVAKVGLSLDAAEIIAHCKALIATYKCPRSVELRAEPLPVSAAGKILKTQLREAHWQADARRVN